MHETKRPTASDEVNGKAALRSLRLNKLPRGKAVKFPREVAARRARHAEAERSQLRKLELLGRHTCKISHDFKNLLTILDGNLQMMAAMTSGRRDRTALLVEDAQAATRVLSELVHDLLAFVKREPDAQTLVDLSALAQETARLLRLVVGYGVHLKIDCAVGLRTRVVPARFQSALIDLAANARDAMNGSGTVTLRVEPITLSAAQSIPLGLEAGGYAVVTLTDTGPGIDPNAGVRPFEPFASGKPNGHGIGLAAVREFAEQVGGAAWIRATLGQGTIAGFCIPLLEKTTRTGHRDRSNPPAYSS